MRTLLAVTVATALLATAGVNIASAVPPSNATVDCGSKSEGYKSWVSITSKNLSCEHAKHLAVHWSKSCASPKPGKTETCHPSQVYNNQHITFACSSLGKSGPNHYVVTCAAPYHHVTFVYYPYGF